MNKPLIGLRDYARKVASEGMILLENNNNVLPLINKKIAIYGRIQSDYYKSGTGSGGLVNVTDVPSFIDAFLENPRLDINEQVLEKYNDWLLDNSFNAGNGMWASEPWSQVEMEFSSKEMELLKRPDEIAVMIIGRTAGEDRDNYLGEGSYLLTKTEYNVLKNLKSVYEEVVVILNVGNVIDLNFVKELEIDGLLLAWHGGQDGARATADVLTGYINPSGKLPTSIIKDLNNYIATKYFGDKLRNEYIEDIYVGYRFHETFIKEDVLYPFGYGLSYTDFKIELIDKSIENYNFNFKFEVTNTGDISGKEVVQLYLSAPQGKLGKPVRELVSFVKTELIKPNEKVIVSLSIDLRKYASYDDLGLVQKSAYILEKGIYEFYYGNSVRSENLALTYEVESDLIIEQLTEALAPYKSFERIRPLIKNDKFIIEVENTSKRELDIFERLADNLPKEHKPTKDNHQLIDVYNEKVTLDEYVASLSFDELRTIIIGEGMSSPKVTSGTASAFGGVTDDLLNKGIPILAMADGPSGIRMDSGMTATSLPNGTLIASTFNPELVTSLYELEGHEMTNYNIDVLLGPGMNIQRHPLNGRNFEYFSEDPLLTGIMASAVIKGLNNVGVFGALKHFAANNQELARSKADSVISERALREIYLRPFEITVKAVDANVIMTSYNPINGIWAAGNYDLNTKVLRDEWGFEGIVITDWWAKMNHDQDEESITNIASMVKAQNDLYMVQPNALEFENNLIEQYEKGFVKLSELQRNAKNILSFILKTKTFSNQFNVDTFKEKPINDWFVTSKAKVTVAKDNIKTTFSEKFDETLNEKFDVIETKGNITYVLKEDELKVYGLTEKVIKNEFDEILCNINNDLKAYELPNNNWGEVNLDLAEATISNTNNLSWDVINKDAIYTFPINVSTFGKYIVELNISSLETNITQMPFSIFTDNINKQTLTTNGTNGEKINISAQIIIEPERKFLSFKFHKTGISIHGIKVIKHG